jgi:tetratricopeptide (TPR) repeat protein
MRFTLEQLQFALLVLIASLFHAAFLAADVIYLKTGRKIECDSAWQESKEVRYMVADGIVGIPKSMVAKIVRSSGARVQASAVPFTNNQQNIQGTASGLNRQLFSKQSRVQELNWSGKSLAQKKDYAGALESFQKAYEISKDAETTLNLALAYFALNDTWNAELYFREVLKTNPNEITALNCLGEIAWKREDLSEAESFWRRSLELKKDDAIKQKLARVIKEKKASMAYENSTSRHFLMKYDGGAADPGLVREVSDYLEETYQKLSRQFDAYPTAPFVVVLYPRTAFFNSTDAPMWSAGVNDGKIKLPIMGIDSLNDDLRLVLTHELTHSFINFKTSGNCPVWLQEGLAQYSEGRRTGSEAREALTALSKNSKLPPIERLSGSFSGANSDVAGVVYAESLAFTEYLIERYRFYQVNELLNRLEKGDTLEEAFQQAFFVSLSQAQSDWRTQLAQN